jgi:hypothetical protein
MQNEMKKDERAKFLFRREFQAIQSSQTRSVKKVTLSVESRDESKSEKFGEIRENDE